MPVVNYSIALVVGRKHLKMHSEPVSGFLRRRYPRKLPALNPAHSIRIQFPEPIPMAYAALLGSVADDAVIGFRGGSRTVLESALVVRCSHLPTSWVAIQELRELLREAIDGGDQLRGDLWHPFRPPIWHPSSAAAEIASKLRAMWDQILREHPEEYPGWYGVEIGKVLQVFEHAAANHQGVVSFLEKPWDQERAQRVSIPLIEKITGE